LDLFDLRRGMAKVLPVIRASIKKLRKKVFDGTPWQRINNWNWTALGTCVIAFFTILIYFVGRYQWYTFQEQLTVMQGQLNAMEADQRPWMKIEKLAPYISPIDPRIGGLRFSGPNTVGFLPLNFLLKNVGHSPALDVRVGIGQFFGHAQNNPIWLKKNKRTALLWIMPSLQLPWSLTIQPSSGSFFPVTRYHITQSHWPYYLLNSTNWKTMEKKGSHYGFTDAFDILLPTRRSRIKLVLHIW
jgi:hypothetical protein